MRLWPWLALCLGWVLYGTVRSYADIYYGNPDQDSYATTAGDYFNTELDVGFRNLAAGVSEYRAALQFSLPASLSSALIQKATLSLYHFDSWGSFSNRTIYAQRLLEPWSEWGLFFDSQTAGVESSAVVGGNVPAFFHWDVTSAVQLWAANPATNYGILLVADPAGLIDNTHRFYSSRMAAAWTSLEIDYVAPPQVTQPPLNVIAVVGDQIYLNPTVTGTAPLSYQWWKDSQPVSGATNLTLIFQSVRLSDAGSYTLAISNVAGGVVTTPAVVTVLQPPTLLQQPTNQTVGVGTNLTLSVQASSSYPIDYQWFHDRAPLPGANSASLTLTNVQTADAGFYSVAISNQLGPGMTSGFSLYVVQMPFTPPPELWRVPFVMTNSGYAYGQPFLVEDAAGALVMLAGVQTPGGAVPYSSLFLSKVSRSGTLLWSVTYPEPYGRAITPAGLTTDAIGNVYVASYCSESLYVLKFSPDGQRTWASAGNLGFVGQPVYLLPDTGAGLTLWTAGSTPDFVWFGEGGTEFWPAGGWATLASLDQSGAFVSSQPFGDASTNAVNTTLPIPATVTVLDSSNLSALAWAPDGSNFGVYNLNMSTTNYLVPQLWSSNSAPLPLDVLVRESPIGVHIASLLTFSLQVFSRTGSPLWPSLDLPYPGPGPLVSGYIPDLQVDYRGNSFFAAIFQNRADLDKPYLDLAFYRVRPTGELAWYSRYSDAKAATNLVYSRSVCLLPDDGGGVCAVVNGSRPELVRISNLGNRLWDLAEARSVPAVIDLSLSCPVVVSADQSITLAVRDLSGGASPGDLFLVRRGSTNPPPAIAIGFPANGATVATNVPLQITTTASGPGANPVSVEVFLDGNWAGTSTTLPFSFTLPALSPGNHTLQTCAFDTAGNYTWSAKSLIYAGQLPPPLTISSNDLRKVLLVAYATESHFHGLTNSQAVFESVLRNVVSSIRQNFPELPVSFYPGLIDQMRAEAAAGPAPQSLGNSLKTRKKIAQPADAVAAFQQYGTGWAEWALDFVNQKVAGGASIVNTIGGAVRQGAGECTGDSSLVCNAATFWQLDKTNVTQLLQQAQEDAQFGVQVLQGRFQDISNEVDKGTQQILQDFNNQFGGVSNQLGQVLGNLQGLMDGQGQLVFIQNALEASFGSVMADTMSAMSNQLAIGQQILGLQQDTFGFLTNQVAQAEQTADAQYASELQPNGLEAGVDILSTLVDLGGDHALAQKISTVGESYFKFSNALAEFDNTEEVGELAASATLCGGFVGIGLALTQSMQDTGPTQDEIVLQQLAALQGLIVDLGKRMDARFDHVDQELNAIYKNFSAEFASINFVLGQMQTQLVNIQASLTLMNEKLDTIQQTQYLLARDSQRSDFSQEASQLPGWVPGITPISYDQFNLFRGDFYAWSTSNALSETFSPIAGLDTNNITSSLTTAGNLPASLSYLAALAADNQWLPITSQFSGPQVNPVEWAAGVTEYLKLVNTWPLLARTNQQASNDLQILKGTGENLNNALQSLSLVSTTGHLVANRAFWDNLFSYYRAKANDVLTALDAYEVQQRTNLIAQSDGSLSQAAVHTDFWGDLSQPQATAYFEPAFGTSPMNHAGTQTDLDSTPLSPPTGLAAQIESAGLNSVVFAELLGLVHSTMTYGDISMLNESVRNEVDCIVKGGAQEWEANFNIAISGYLANLVTPSIGDSPIFSADYTSPTKNLSKIVILSVPYEFDCSLGIMSCINQQEWCDRSSFLKTMWNGGNEPPNDSRPVPAVSGLFSAGATISSYLDVSPYGGYYSLRQWLEFNIESKLRSLQIAYYQNAFTGSQAALQTAANELSGARAVLESFIRLAFPQSYESGDTFRSFFYSSEPLPDGPALAQLCQQGILLSQNSADHTDRIHFDQILNQRLVALETAISNKLTRIARAGQAESLPLLTDTLNQIARAQSVVNEPLSPPWLFVSTATNTFNVTVLGQDAVPYSLQYSTNLADWVDFTPPITIYTFTHQEILPNGANPIFIRARVPQ